MEAILYTIGLIACAGGACWLLHYVREVRPIKRKCLHLEEMCVNKIISRITWITGDISRNCPDMILVEGGQWLFEPFIDPSVSQTHGEVPPVVQKFFAEMMPHKDKALKVLEMYRKRATGIMLTRVDVGGSTSFVGYPVSARSLAPTNQSR
ncbi:MAG: hypothetical protein JO019_03750 [Candidatus Kaiserbacteria bacterium]|nr:hypothetical protein [Candidatus Kaiserbacteria bacterium]